MTAPCVFTARSWRCFSFSPRLIGSIRGLPGESLPDPRRSAGLCFPSAGTGGVSISVLDGFFLVFLLLSVLNGALFLSPRWTKAAFWLLIALNLIKLLVIATDYRFRLNQHIMAFWITMAFLFLPKKEQTLKILVVFFYFWAGILKFSPEWLSGSALYAKPWLFGASTLPLACGYVLVLEVFLVWLLADRAGSPGASGFNSAFHLFPGQSWAFFTPR